MPLPRLAGVFQFAFGFNFEQPVVVELEEELGSSENRSSWRIDVFWFLELEEELGLFCEIINGRRRSGTRTWNGRQGWSSKKPQVWRKTRQGRPAMTLPGLAGIFQFASGFNFEQPVV